MQMEMEEINGQMEKLSFLQTRGNHVLTKSYLIFI